MAHWMLLSLPLDCCITTALEIRTRACVLSRCSNNRVTSQSLRDYDGLNLRCYHKVHMLDT